MSSNLTAPTISTHSPSNVAHPVHDVYCVQAAKGRDVDFDALIAEATKLLRGETLPAGLEPDEARDRLLAGFQYIFVDEYQDIDEPQYQLISAIAGRTIEDARKTLAVFDRTDVRPSFPQQMNGRGTHRYQFRAQVSSPATWLNYKMLALEDIHLGYPGHFGPNHRIHHALAALNPGDKLMMRSLPGNGLGLFVCGDTCVARFSRSAQTDWAEKLGSVSEVNVLAMLRRSAEQDTDECRRKGYLVPEWEIPVVEVVLRFPTGTEQS